MKADPGSRFVGDPAAAASADLADRRDLAFVAMERTRMPMVVTDPNLPDNPIVLANRAFLDLTGYDADEVVGRNCRFLQGEDTDPAAVAEIRQAIRERRDLTIELLNYDRQGRSFWNQLLISPILDQEGSVVYFFASQMDVTHRRQAIELERAERQLLKEVDHRAKNALALVQGIVRLSRADDAASYSTAVQGRVEALARAHTLLSDNRWRRVPLRRIVENEVAAFGKRRVAMSGPRIELPAAQVQPLALVIHELATNAAAHGALSRAGGTVAIDWREEDGSLHIDWRETGGPERPSPQRPGFGSAIIDAIVRRQLRGRFAQEWQESGLNVAVTLPA